MKEALRLLTLAGLVSPVTHTAANGLPLDSEKNDAYRKYLYLDTGLLLRTLYLETGDISGLTKNILLQEANDLVNKGSLAEMAAGLELIHYSNPERRKELHYWVRTEKNSLAEVDYLLIRDMTITPLEIKASTKGGMKSMYLFLRNKGLKRGIRSSLENFSVYENEGLEVEVIPLYALSNL